MKYIKIKLTQTWGDEYHFFDIQSLKLMIYHQGPEEVSIEFYCGGKCHKFHYSIYGDFFETEFEKFLSTAGPSVFTIPLITEDAWLKIERQEEHKQ